MASPHRYIPNTEQDQQAMLSSIGLAAKEELFADIPPAARLQRKLNLPETLSEEELLAHLKELAGKNADHDRYVSFLGAGVYDHFSPSVIDQLLLRSEFYTAYTPYQAEVSQGTLTAIFEYQTMICELTGMDVSNASMYDGATGLAEAAVMAVSATRRSTVLISRTVHPAYREVLTTYSKGRSIEIKEVDYDPRLGTTDLTKLEKLVDDQTAAVIMQNPNFFGCLEDGENISSIAKGKQALLVAAVDPVSLALLKAPAEYGADIVVGEGQGLGIPQSFGGPLLGFFAATQSLIRKMPGRIVGQTQDAHGRRGYVLTLQTREQHIRREHATSNICSNEGLCALAATMYLTFMGKAGLREVAEQSLQKAHYLAEAFRKAGFVLPFAAPFFKEFVADVKSDPLELNERLLSDNILGGYALKNDYPELPRHALFCATERRTKEQMNKLVTLMGREAK